MGAVIKIALLLLIAATQWTSAANDVIAMGNLAVVVRGEKLFSTDIDPQRPPTPDLWCQASLNGEVQHSTWARFVRLRDRKVFMADMDDEQNRARLHFGMASAEHAGKYRCEIRTADGNLIFGNLFAYSHPVVRNNDSFPLTVSETEPALVTGETISASYKTSVHIPCPIIGYPEPNIVWFKDNFALEADERRRIHRHSLQIDDLQSEDEGVYRCVATNQFPVQVDGPEQEFELKLDQKLRVGGNYGWMLPLAIILIILLILFLIIYTCQRCATYKSDHYNVAEHERTLHSDGEPLKNSV